MNTIIFRDSSLLVPASVVDLLFCFAFITSDFLHGVHVYIRAKSSKYLILFRFFCLGKSSLTFVWYVFYMFNCLDDNFFILE